MFLRYEIMKKNIKAFIFLGLILLFVKAGFLKDLIGVGIILSLMILIVFDHFKSFAGTGSSKKLQDFAAGFHSILEYARNLFSTSDSLKKVVMEEHDAVTKSSAALEEISSMLSKTADSANQLASMAQDAQSSVHIGKKAVTDLLSGLTIINTSTENLSGHIDISLGNLVGIINNLSEIKAKTNVINDIVFQTKLLSFNASVEAARAGDHGKGFAVVAEEMSNLAATSGFASKEISEILQKNLDSTQQIVEEMKLNLTSLMRASKEDVRRSLDNAKSSSQSFDQINKKVEDVARMSDEISSATKEQDIGVREITKAINQLQTTSDQLSNVSEQTLKAALSLSEHTDKQSKELFDLGKSLGIKVLFPVKPFDFEAAISAHLDWKMKLSRYLEKPDQSLDPQKVCLDDACALGKWIYGDGKQYSHLATHESLRVAHGNFHQTAADIITLIHTKKLKDAHIKLAPNGVYMDASERCVSLITKLRNEVEGTSLSKKKIA